MSFLGLAEEMRDSAVQPTNMIASQVKRAFEQEQAPSPPHTPFPVIMSTSTLEEMGEMPELEEMQPTLFPTVEELEEMFEQEEIQLAPVITRTSAAEEIVKMPAEQKNMKTTLTLEEMEEMPELEEVQPTPLPVITLISTVEELEEMFERQLDPLPAITSTSAAETIVVPEEHKNVQTTSPVPPSITDDSQTRHEDAGGHLIAPILKVEDPDIDISDEHIEGGDSDEDEGGDESLWQNEVSLPNSKDRKLLIDNFSLSERRGRGGPEQLGRCISSRPVERHGRPVHG